MLAIALRMYETNTARGKEEVRCVVTLFWRDLVAFAGGTIYASWEVEYNVEVLFCSLLCYLKSDATGADARVTVKLPMQRHHTGAPRCLHTWHTLWCVTVYCAGNQFIGASPRFPLISQSYPQYTAMHSRKAL